MVKSPSKMWMEKIKNPIVFQGERRRRDYFEGWYYKLVTKDWDDALSLIPGISLFREDPHCFVQYILVRTSKKKKTTKTGYLRFDHSDFLYNHHPFRICVADNAFTETSLSINLKDHSQSLNGDIAFGPFTQIKKTFLIPNIMGPFAYLSHMECYHGVISMNHELNGSIRVDEDIISFDGGKGYIEKDWGRSFPKKYLWIQCNHFHEKETSLMCSIAEIPLFGGSFQGFLCNLVLGGIEYRFATYKGSRMRILNTTRDHIRVQFEDWNTCFVLEATLGDTGELMAPQMSGMKKTIKEGMTGQVIFTLQNKKTNQMKRDDSYMAGIEIVGY